MTTSSDIPWYDAVAYPPRAGTLRWSCRLAMMLKEQVVMVTQGAEDFWGPIQAYPSLLALAGELLARPERVRHFVLVLDEHEPTRTHNARIVFANNFPMTNPQNEIQRLLPVAERALQDPGTRFARPIQAAIILAPPYTQPHLHLINREEVR